MKSAITPGIASAVERAVHRGVYRPFGGGRSKTLPRNGLLLYLARPNSDEYLAGEDTEIGEDTYIWGYVLPDDADIRAATGWVSGTANVFYTDDGTPIVALATEIDRAILPANVVWRLTDETQQTGRLAIYTAATAWATIEKARSVLRDDSIDHLFFGTTGILYDQQDLATMYQDATGTLPVYRPGSGAVDPPVGLLLDKSGGGYHASQNTTTARPKLSGRYNLLTATEDFTSVYWIKQSSTFSGTLLTRTSTNGAEACLQFLTGTIDAGTPLKFSVKAKGSTPDTYLCIRIINVSAVAPGGIVLFNLNTGAMAYTGAAYTGKCSITPTTDGAYECSIEGVSLSSPAAYRVDIGVSNTIGGLGGTAGAAVHVLRADLRVKRNGSSLPPYQRVDSATTYDTVGFPLYLRRDKVDDDLIVQAPAITGVRAWGSIDTVDIAAATIAAGSYQPFGTINAGEPTCTQWIAIDGALTAAEQAVLERYVYSKSKLPVGV